MADKRIRLFMEHWYQLNLKKYGHTPFNWSVKHGKLIQSILKQFDQKAMNHKLLYNAADFYFRQDGFEKVQCHSFGMFFNNFQKYLQPVIPTVTKPRIEKKEEPVDPLALEKFIKNKGPDVIQEFNKSRKFMPKLQYEKAIGICKNLWPDMFKIVNSVKIPPLESRKDALLRQAKILLENNQNALLKI